MSTPIIKPVIGPEERYYLEQCLDSGFLTQGKFVSQFEQAVATFTGAQHAVAVTSGTAALHLALLALGIGKGDEVIVPSLTWVATANAVSFVGATPVFVDICPETFTIDPHEVKKAISPRTRAIIAVHLFGLCADVDALLPLCTAHNLKLVEDAACALGSKYQGRPAGTLGDVGCFSFHPRKVITTGEGGMLTTHDEMLAKTLCQLRNHGCAPLEENPAPWTMPEVPLCGYNYRMTNIQGAIGCAQMEKITLILKERARLAETYTSLLASSDIIAPSVPSNYTHSWQSYVVRFRTQKLRNAAASRLQSAEIETRPGTHAVHRLKWQHDHGLRTDCCPQAALCEDTSLALPMVHGMSKATQEQIVSLLCA